MTILRCTDLCVGHDGRAAASSISFRIEEGDYIAVIGENGSGKSTLVSTILGIIPPISGSIDFSGEVKPKIGYLPQNHQMQHDFPALVEEVVLSGALRGSGKGWFATKEHRVRARQAITQLGIQDLAKRKFSSLSGGQRQKALLARAVCAADGLLVLDEPVSGLDPTATEEMYQVVKSLHRELGVAILAITHDIPAGLRDATHVLTVGENPSFVTVDEYRKEAGNGLGC